MALQFWRAAVPAELPEQGRFKLASAYSGSYDDMAYLPEDPCPVVERLMRTVYAMDGCNNVDSDFQIIDVIDTVAPVHAFRTRKRGHRLLRTLGPCLQTLSS